MNTTFTKQEFYAEILRFREYFGSKEWWTKSVEQRDLCIKGLSHMYFNLVDIPQKEFETISSTFQGTLAEYNRRATMLGILT